MKKLMSENVAMVPHSIHGAKYCFAKANSFQHIAEILGNIIMSHHGLLYDNVSPGGETVLKDVLTSKTEVKIAEELPIDFKLLNNEFMNIIKPFHDVRSVGFITSVFTEGDFYSGLFTQNKCGIARDMIGWHRGFQNNKIFCRGLGMARLKAQSKTVCG